MKRFGIITGALCAVLILLSSVGPAMAYFTTYTRAKGGYTLTGASKTEITEQFEDWTKSIRITNFEGGGPVFVRVKAFAGSEYALVWSGDGNWRDGGDGWWYYIPVLEAQTRLEDGSLSGGTASGLSVSIMNVPTDAEPGDSFNVIVVYESTPVQYDDAGHPFADWSMRLDARSVEE